MRLPYTKLLKFFLLIILLQSNMVLPGCTTCDEGSKHNSLIEGQVVEGWVAYYNNTSALAYGNWNKATAIAVDKLGSIYVTGESAGEKGGYDDATIKYDSNGSISG
jgi:hypothetical protein